MCLPSHLRKLPKFHYTAVPSPHAQCAFLIALLGVTEGDLACECDYRKLVYFLLRQIETVFQELVGAPAKTSSDHGIVPVYLIKTKSQPN